MKHANGGELSRDANEEMDMDIQRKSLAAVHSNRLSRSRSRHIMDRAKSFERAAAEAAAGGTTNNAASGYNSNASSRPGSRAGSVARNRRSPSVGRQLGTYGILSNKPYDNPYLNNAWPMVTSLLFDLSNS